MSELRVVAVTVKDVLGAEEFAMTPSRITTLKGRNGTGKSTALAAVQAALGGGSLARIARVGKKGEKIEPEVVLVIEGEGSEAYRVERTGDKVRVRARVGDTAAFEDVGRPQGWLSSLYDPHGSNPVTFLTAKDDDRATMLLEALPLVYDRAELLKKMGIAAEDLPPIPAGLHPLEDIAWIRGGVFSTRTGVNRDEKSAAASADQLRRNTPAIIPDDPGGEAQGRLEAAAIALAREITSEDEKAGAAEETATAAARHTFQTAEAVINGDFKRDAAKLRAEQEQQAAARRAEAERWIAERAAKVEAEIERLRVAGEERLDTATAVRDATVRTASELRAEARARLAARQGDLTSKREELATLRERRESSAKARALDEQAKQFDAEAVRLVEESKRLTAAIDQLDAFRRQLAKDLPIPGLEIEGKQIRVDGVPFEQLNTAQRVDIAVQVATLRAKGSRLPVIFVDGAEALDSENFEHLVARLKAEGVQAFLGRVTDEPFAVTTEGATA